MAYLGRLCRVPHKAVIKALAGASISSEAWGPLLRSFKVLEFSSLVL